MAESKFQQCEIFKLNFAIKFVLRNLILFLKNFYEICTNLNLLNFL